MTSDPDIDEKHDLPSHSYWNVLYTQSIRVNIGTNNAFGFTKTADKMEKSFREVYFQQGRDALETAFLDSHVAFAIQTVMFFALHIISCTLCASFLGDLRSTALWFLGVMFTGMIYAVDFRLRNPGDPLWLYRPIFTFLTTFVYTWLLPYAALTIKNKAWR